MGFRLSRSSEKMFAAACLLLPQTDSDNAPAYRLLCFALLAGRKHRRALTRTFHRPFQLNGDGAGHRAAAALPASVPQTP